MRIVLVTSPHLDHSVYHQGHDRAADRKKVRYAQCFAPMGLLSLAGATGKENTVLIYDINKDINNGNLPLSRYFYEAAAQWLAAEAVDLVGFMTDCDSFHHTIRICQELKRRSPSTVTVLGGTHASATSHQTLRDFHAVDFIIRGEGELAFSNLLETLKDQRSPKTVGSLTYRLEGNVRQTLDLPLIEDLDTLPFPDLSRIRLEPQDVIYLEIGRGCPFKCNFCFTAPYWKRKHRIKSPERIIAEILYLKQDFGRTDFNFTHDLFTTDHRWVIDFCRKLIASGLSVTWTCSSRTDTIDEDLIEWMRLAGCRDIYFGIETGTVEMQEKIDKNLNLDEADEIVRKAADAGIGTTIGFIAGLPGESRGSMKGTLNMAFSFLDLPRATIHLFGFGPYRGSAHFDQIFSNLIFDPHFVDFPLPEEVHEENCSMMSTHFEIFSRYSRFVRYEDLSVDTLRAAEEFFPIVNALRPLMLSLYHADIELTPMLDSWTAWISSMNAQRGVQAMRRFQGTVADFLAFISIYLQEIGRASPVFEEIIRWESLKNIFRSRSYRPPRVSVSGGGTDMNTLFANPSVVVDRFQYASQFLLGSQLEGFGGRPGEFAFYLCRDERPAIVRLTPIARLLLETARGGTSVGSLKQVYLAAGRHTKFGALTEDAFPTLLEQLQELDLLFRPVYQSGPSPS